MTPLEEFNAQIDSSIFVLYRLQFVKIIAFSLVITAFFLEAYTLWFNLAVSVILGSLYYLMVETQPQLTCLILLILKYQLKKFYTEWIKTPLKNFSNFFVQDNINMLQEEDEYQSLEYQDCKYHKKYIYLFNKKLRSNDLIIFKDENGDDVTDYIEPYLGPLQDFHGSLLTPKDFNHKKLSVFRDGEVSLIKTFEENDPIVLN